MKVQWDVVWSVLRTLLVAGGPVGTLLVALGFPPVQVGTYLGIALAAVGVLSVAVPGLVGALKQTDAAKVQAPATVPGVESKVIVDPKVAAPSVVAIAADPAQPNVTVDATKT